MKRHPLTIVVPMAGRGSRFADAGYTLPKPLIEVRGRSMINLVIENLRPSTPHRFVFICQADHVREHDLRPRLEAWAPGCAIVELEGVTEGAACTVLAARDLIDDAPLMIANSDQYVEVSIDRYIESLKPEDDGLIMTMTADDPKWSFVSFDDRGRVDRVVEKEVISSEATVGIYNFASGSAFVDAADRMIAAQRRVNGEFYVAPVYNEMIDQGACIAVHNIGAEAAGMWGLGTPSDLDRFLSEGPDTSA